MPPRKKKRKLRSNIIKWVISLAIAFFFRFPLILEQFKLEQNPKPEFFLAQAPMAEEKGAVKAAKPDTEIRSFSLTNEQINNLKQKLGITPSDKPAEILTKIYLGLYAGEKKKESGSFGIAYELGKGITKSPEEVLDLTKPEEKRKPKGDCDEITRMAYLIAAKSGVKNLIMVEMRWAEEGKEVGHTTLVLLGAGEKPLLFDFTHGYNTVPLDSTNVEEGMKKKYTKPDMRIERQLKTLQEAEASHYDQVGSYYLKNKNWALVAEAYEKLGDYKDAVTYYQDALKLAKPESVAEVCNALGYVYNKLNQGNKAIIILNRGLDSNPDLFEHALKENITDAYVSEAVRYHDQRNFSEALRHFEDAYKHSPEDQEIRKNIEYLRKKLGK